jgi:hypothetical protein
MEKMPTQSYQVPRPKDLRPPSASPTSDPTWKDLGVAAKNGRADASKPPSFGLDRDPNEEGELLVDPSDDESTRKIDRVFANLGKSDDRRKTHVWAAAGKTPKGKN